MASNKIGSLSKGRCRVCLQVYAGEKRGWVWVTSQDNSNNMVYWAEGKEAMNFGNTKGAFDYAYEVAECLTMNMYSCRVVVQPDCANDDYWVNPIVGDLNDR